MKLTISFLIVTLSAVAKLGGIQLVALVIPRPNVIPLISVILVQPLNISSILVTESLITVIGD